MQSINLTDRDMDNRINPFEKRDHLCRSPPRPRTGSLTEFEDSVIAKSVEKVHEQASKRKRTDEADVNTTSNLNVDQMQDVLAEIHKQAKQLEKVLADMYKPKQELKETASRLLRGIEKLRDTDFKKWIDHVTLKSQALRNRNEELTRKLRSMEGKLEAQAEAGVRNLSMYCEECTKANTREERRSRLTYGQCYETFQSISEDDWLADILPKTLEDPRCIWDAPIECQIALPCNKNLEVKNRSTKKAIDIFGGKPGLLKQQKGRGEVATMSHSLGFPDQDGNFMETKRFLYYPIFADEKLEDECEDKDMYRAMESIKQLMLQNGKTKLAVPAMDGVVGTVLNRIVRYLFFNTNVSVYTYAAEATKGKSLQSTKSTPNEVKRNEVKRPKQRKGDTLVVKMQGKTYADLLRTVREKVNPSEIGVEVSEVRRARNGELLVQVRNGADKVETLKREITEKLPTAVADKVVIKKVLHIKGLDEVTTREEVAAAISKEISAGIDTFEVRPLRPAFGNKQNCTVIVSAAAADKLIEKRKIKLGWTVCRIVERVEDNRCYRCWEYGHFKTECKGPNREVLCVKCAGEGHKASECQNNPYCVHCQKEGHQSSSWKCPVVKSKKETPNSNRNGENTAN